MIESWRREYNSARPHSSLGRLTPAEFAERSRSVAQTEAVDERLAIVAEGLLTIAETGTFLRISRATADRRVAHPAFFRQGYEFYREMVLRLLG